MRAMVVPVFFVVLACGACGATGTDTATQPRPTATARPASTPTPSPTVSPPPTSILIELEFDLTAPGAILAWQQFLVQQGHDLVLDGIFGPASATATADWQATAGLPVTGELDSATFGSMALAEPPSSETNPTPAPATTRPAPTATPRPVPTRMPVPIPTLWIDVKYRDTDVNVAAPYFVALGRSDATVWDAWYDSGNRYMVIVLGGTAYHYCSMPSSEWSNLQAAPDLYGQYEAAIRGNFDCRIFPEPTYSN
mgnify:CR=1 FL=1